MNRVLSFLLFTCVFVSHSVANEASEILRKAASKFNGTKSLYVQMEMRLYDAFEGGKLIDEKKGYHKIKDSLYKYVLGEISVFNFREALVVVDKESKSIDIQGRSALNIAKVLYVDTTISAKLYNYKVLPDDKYFKVKIEGKKEGMNTSVIFIDKKNYTLKKVVLYTISEDEYFSEENEPLTYYLRMEVDFKSIKFDSEFREDEFSLNQVLLKGRKNEFIAVEGYKSFTITNHIN